MNIKEFKKLSKTADCKKPFFDLFEIRCKKCNSSNVEFLGRTVQGTGYYKETWENGYLVVKCHTCGNAKTFDLDNNTEYLGYEKTEEDIELEVLK